MDNSNTGLYSIVIGQVYNLKFTNNVSNINQVNCLLYELTISYLIKFI